MNDELILTIDLGTTRLKVALFTKLGSLIAQTMRRNQEFVDDDRAWQRADDWWRDAVSAVSELLASQNIDATRVVAISVSGRAGAAVFIDSNGQVLIDPWSDGRHADIQNELASRIDAPNYALALLAKSRWARDNGLDHDKVMYAKDFLVYRLCGESVTDPSSGPDGDWQQPWYEAARLSIDALPRVQFPWTLAGELTATAAASLGLARGTPVCVGAHDGISANIGAGAIEPGQFALTLGTHGVVRTVSASHPTGAMRFYGFPPNLHVIGGNALMAGRAIDWFIDNWFDIAESNRGELLAQLDKTLLMPTTDKTLFMPWLGGQLSPTRISRLRGGFHGLAHRTSRTDMYRALVEGVSFAIGDVFEQVVGWTTEPLFTSVTGRGVNGLPWLQLLANVTGRALSVTDASSEGRGAAILCAVALGDYSTLDDAVRNMVKVTRVIEPCRDDALLARRQAWQRVSQFWQSPTD